MIRLIIFTCFAPVHWYLLAWLVYTFDVTMLVCGQFCNLIYKKWTGLHFYIIAFPCVFLSANFMSYQITIFCREITTFFHWIILTKFIANRYEYCIVIYTCISTSIKTTKSKIGTICIVLTGRPTVWHSSSTFSISQRIGGRAFSCIYSDFGW